MPIYASMVSPGYMPAVVETTADICGRNGSVVGATMGSSYLPSRCPDECGLVGTVMGILEHVYCSIYMS
jgi:hypothetical protein